MLIKQITILLSLALFAVLTLAEAWDYDAALAELRATWAKEISLDLHGRPIDPATECFGKPCDYPELVQYDLSDSGVDPDDLPEATWDEDLDAEERRAYAEEWTGENWCVMGERWIEGV
ncbi:MAG: hypothetical protein J3R72DRAFT_447332 [Linnemannia gamsii]|nr:MAG: hypothetical protein J3R72DRAFT_447332 [Linnemannia gamsii]